MVPPRALLLFAKSPKPGKVKTRLLSAISPQEAAALHEACIADTLRLARSIPNCDVLLFTAGGRAYFQKLLSSQKIAQRIQIFSQQGPDLGARMAHAFRKTFRLGYREAVIIGTDTPWMGAKRLQQAFAALRTTDVVLGPAEDGGYYLLALRKSIPQLFRNIPWGTHRVLKLTLQAAAAVNLRVKLLRKDFDLDRPQDLRRAARALKRNPRHAPQLAKTISQITNQ